MADWHGTLADGHCPDHHGTNGCAHRNAHRELDGLGSAAPGQRLDGIVHRHSWHCQVEGEDRAPGDLDFECAKPAALGHLVEFTGQRRRFRRGFGEVRENLDQDRGAVASAGWSKHRAVDAVSGTCPGGV